jgi:hypothetical protein
MYNDDNHEYVYIGEREGVESNLKCVPILSICSILSYIHIEHILYQWCNGKRVRVECGRSCVRSLVRSNKRKKRFLLLLR